MVRVLVVDDEPAILRSTALLLRDMGFEVHEAGDARGILERAREIRPDIILQDLRMPGLDLGAVVRQLRAAPELKDVPVLLFSASLDAPDVAHELDVGLLEKPARPNAMASAIQSALEGSTG